MTDSFHSANAETKSVHASQPVECDHRFITATAGKGCHCASRDCGVRLLSLSLPIPMPLIERAFDALTNATGAT